MTNIIIPMAGAGQRFVDAGYKEHKPVIETIDRRTGNKLPMVVCATYDLPEVLEDGSNITYIDRYFHKKDGVEDKIRQHFPKANFISVEHLTEGQACTCLLAEDRIDNDIPLLIAGCDNGMVINTEKFQELTKESDVIVFTYRHNESVLDNPNAYGWVIPDDTGTIQELSIKKAVSDTPMEDHAIVATFWFKEGRIFVQAAKKMIQENDRVNGEFYVDEVIKHTMELGYVAKVFEIERYIGWGTPADYENYMNTLSYWKRFVQENGFLPGRK